MRKGLKDQILSILQAGHDLTLATSCEDGWPYASTVSYASDGLRIYFGCSAGSLKALNIKRDPRVSLTVNLPHGSWSEIRGLCIAARARLLVDVNEIARVGDLFEAKFPQMGDFVADSYKAIRLFELTPALVAILDYRKGFGHTDRVEVEAADLAA